MRCPNLANNGIQLVLVQFLFILLELKWIDECALCMEGGLPWINSRRLSFVRRKNADSVISALSSRPATCH